MRITKKIERFEKIIELEYTKIPELSTKYFTTYHVFEINGNERRYLYDKSLTPFKIKELEERNFCEGYITKDEMKKILDRRKNKEIKKLNETKQESQNLESCLRKKLKTHLKKLFSTKRNMLILSLKLY